MNHLAEEDLILYYYGEAPDARGVETHLAGCEACRAEYAALQRVLNVVESFPVPERAENYGRQVWERLGLGSRRSWIPWRWPARRWAAAAGVAALMLGAFLAGRFSPGPPRSGRAAASAPQVRERVLLVALGDHLERSQMVLVELANANPRRELDISAEQQRASDLIRENRLYRQTAARTGDAAVAGVLDEVARGPSELTPAGLERLRQRIRADGILFKVRVIGSTVQNQEDRAAQNPAARKL